MKANKDEKLVSRPTYDNNLKIKYKKEIISKLMKNQGFKNSMATPRIERIVINSGIGKYSEIKGLPEKILQDLAKISGQKPVFTKAKKAISGFKIKENQIIGIKVTLRGRKMYDFLERLIVSTLPRIRDFRGISKNCFGQRGNVNIGIKEHVAFPEIDSENTDLIFGLQVNIVNTAKNQREGIELLKAFGLPMAIEED